MSGILAQFGVVEELQSNTPVMSSIVPSAGPPSIFTITFASAHGLQAQDTLTISGATPSTYNGTWTIASVPTTTTAVVVTPSTLAANTTPGSYIAGIYGRGGTPTRFYDIEPGEGLKGVFNRIESDALRANGRVQAADRFAINRLGATGPVTLPVMTRGFGLWFKEAFGAVAVSGPTDSAYTQTFTIGPMMGLSVLAQIGRPFTQSQMLVPFTYPGVKILDWTLSCDTDGFLMLQLTLDAYDEKITVVLATASYPTGLEMFSYAGAQISFGGVAVDVKNFSVKCDMGYNVDRRGMRANTLKREPAEAAMRTFTWSATLEWLDVTQYNRVAAATRAGALASLSAVWTAPTLIGATTYPSVTLTAPNARFDDGTPTIQGPDLLPQPLSGRLLKTAGSATNDACTLTYVTLDSTP